MRITHNLGGTGMGKHEEGMTILEVVIAITILLIGTTFIAQSNTLAYKYLHQQELRQKMVFFAAGGMEAVLKADFIVLNELNDNLSSENLVATKVPNADIPNISESLKFELNGSNYDLNSYLTCFGVEVSAPGAPGIPNNYMYNYELQPLQ